MSTDSSVSTDSPTTSAAPDAETAEPAEDAAARAAEDCATTAGGPMMIWIFTGIVVGISWLRRHRRKRRQQH